MQASSTIVFTQYSNAFNALVRSLSKTCSDMPKEMVASSYTYSNVLYCKTTSIAVRSFLGFVQRS
jgi:hypothetical protein